METDQLDHFGLASAVIGKRTRKSCGESRDGKVWKKRDAKLWPWSWWRRWCKCASQMVVRGALNVTSVVEVNHQRGKIFQQGAVHFGIYWENCAFWDESRAEKCEKRPWLVSRCRNWCREDHQGCVVQLRLRQRSETPTSVPASTAIYVGSA